MIFSLVFAPRGVCASISGTFVNVMLDLQAMMPTLKRHGRYCCVCTVEIRRWLWEWQNGCPGIQTPHLNFSVASRIYKKLFSSQNGCILLMKIGSKIKKKREKKKFINIAKCIWSRTQPDINICISLLNAHASADPLWVMKQHQLASLIYVLELLIGFISRTHATPGSAKTAMSFQFPR